MASDLEIFAINQGLLTTSALVDLFDETERQRSSRELRALFFEIVNFIRPKCFLEIGAYEAAFSKQVKARLPGTRVIAFEANPYNHKEFSETTDFAALGIEYRHAAIGRETGTMEFHIQTQTGGSQRAYTGPDNSVFKRVEVGTDYETVNVPCLSLRDLLLSNELVMDDVCAWIDVEGATGEVLTGAKEVLNRISAIHIEVEDRPYWSSQWLSKNVMQFLLDHGFYPIARDYEYVHQYNIIFVRKDVLEHAQYPVQYAFYLRHLAKRR